MNAKPKSGRPQKLHPESREVQGEPIYPQLDSLTGFLLRCASNIADAAYYRQIGKAEITPGQLAILLSLRNGGPMTQAALSVATRMDRSTINEMVPRMIQRGLISKSSVSENKRGIQLSITNQGLETLKQIVPPTVASQEMILASLPKEYRKVFKHCLEIILESNDGSLRD